jgi:Zn-dependent protease
MDIANTIQQVAIAFPAILLAIILHEIAHGYASLKLGDPTAKMMGRLTLNPIPHIDLLGTIILPIILLIITRGEFVFGYAKPVMSNPNNFRNPKADMAKSAAAGPIANLIIAAICMILLNHVTGLPPRFIDELTVHNYFTQMLVVSVYINVLLAVFNMIPIPPLDGSRVLRGFLSWKNAELMDRIEPYGMLVILLLVIMHLTDYLIYPIKFIVGLLSLL